MKQQGICPKCGYIGILGCCQGMHMPSGASCLARQLVQTRDKCDLETRERRIWEKTADILYDILDASRPMDDYYAQGKRIVNAEIIATEEEKIK